MYWSEIEVIGESGSEQKNNFFSQIPILCYYFFLCILWETSEGRVPRKLTRVEISKEKWIVVNSLKCFIRCVEHGKMLNI